MIRISGEATIGKSRGGHVRFGPFIRPGSSANNDSVKQTLTHNLNTKIVSVILTTDNGNNIVDFYWTSWPGVQYASGYKWKTIDNNSIELEIFHLSGSNVTYYADVYSREDFF